MHLLVTCIHYYAPNHPIDWARRILGCPYICARIHTCVLSCLVGGSLWLVCCPLLVFRLILCFVGAVPSLLWCCWLGGRKGIQPVKMSGVVLAWLSVWIEVQTCIWSSWYHCLASVKSRLVLSFWYQLTRIVPDNGLLNGCMCLSVQCDTVIEGDCCSVQARFSGNAAHSHGYNERLPGLFQEASCTDAELQCGLCWRLRANTTTCCRMRRVSTSQSLFV